MDLAFVVSLPSELERFEVLARRLPGSEFVLAPGRWPSDWLDSHRWIARALDERRWRTAAPRRQFSLLVASTAVPARALAPWAAPGARLLRLSPQDSRFGDPRLDPAFDVGAAMRARRQLGLDAHRPIRLVVSAEPERQLARFAAALAPLRSDSQWVVVPSERAWLRSGRCVPRPLHGPGMAIVREECGWGELLAASECVVGDDLCALADAMRLRKPALLLSDVPPEAPQFVRPQEQLLRDALDLLPVVIDPSALARAIDRLRADWDEREVECAATLRRLRRRHDGRASVRMARALARAHARLAIDRVLESLIS